MRNFPKACLSYLTTGGPAARAQGAFPLLPRGCTPGAACSAYRGDFKQGKALFHTTGYQKVPWAILQSFHEPELDKERKADQHKQRNTRLSDTEPASSFSTEERHCMMEARYRSYLAANSDSPLLDPGVGGGYEQTKGKRSTVWCAWNQLRLQIKHGQVCCCCRCWCDCCWNSAWEFWQQTSYCLISFIPWPLLLSLPLLTPQFYCLRFGT